MKKQLNNALQMGNNALARVTECTQRLVSQMDILGRLRGLQKKPMTAAEFNVEVIEHVQISIQRELDANYAEHLPGSMKFEARQIDEDSREAIEKLDMEVREADRKYSLLFDAFKHLAPPQPAKWIRVCVISLLAFVGLAEAYLMYPAMRNFSMPMLGAECASIMIGILAVLGAHHGADYINEAETKIKYNVRYVMVLGLAAISLWTLGIAKARAFNARYDLSVGGAISGMPHTDFPAWLFIISSIICFWGALFVSLRYARTKAEKESDARYWAMKKQVKKAKCILDNKMKTVAKIKMETRKKLLPLAKGIESGASIERAIIGVGPEAVNAFKQSHIRHRSDGLFPHYFATPVHFKFTTYFDNKQNNNLQ